MELQDHPFLHRGEMQRGLIYKAIKAGPATWDAIFAEGREFDFADETMRRTVNDGVSFGAFHKKGGRVKKETPTVELTPLGRWWFEQQQLSKPLADPCEVCGRPAVRVDEKYGPLCEVCDAADEGETACEHGYDDGDDCPFCKEARQENGNGVSENDGGGGGE